MSAAADKYGLRSTRIDSVRTVTLIEVATTEGAGTTDDVVRPVLRFFDPTDGSFIAERDVHMSESDSIGMPLREVAS